LAASRRGHISYLNYAMPLLRGLLKYRPPRIRLEVDGARAFEGHGQLIIGNIARYAFGMRIAQEAVASDGIFDACIFEYRHRMTLFWHVMTALSGQHAGLPGVHAFRGRHFRVESDGPAPVQLDGDPAGTTPIEISVQTHKATFLIPPE
ncbi:MAG TPA: hypothetical protein VNT79_08425, partial [Phycisphaerae bacterium]|nr:hypothetical protein [Phycisphaerae bacterium]